MQTFVENTEAEESQNNDISQEVFERMSKQLSEMKLGTWERWVE